MLAWRGLEIYGYEDIKQRIIYKWLFTVLISFVNFNGVVPEKFDVVHVTHRFHVEVIISLKN
jgi:alpha,alpha-trehalase